MKEFRWVGIGEVAVPEHLLRSLDPHKLDVSDLVPSVREHGILQPLVGRILPDDGDRVELVAGYRRYIAAREVGVEELPFFVGEMSDADTAIIELVENIARRDLPPHREAEAVVRLLAWRLGSTEEEAASTIYRYVNAQKGLTGNAPSEDEAQVIEQTFNQVGRKISYFVTHILPTTKWPEPILKGIEEGVITRQAARKLRKIKSPELLEAAIENIREGMPASDAVSEVLGGASEQKQVSALQAKSDELEGWPMEDGYIVPPPPTVLPEATNFEALERKYLVREVIAMLGWERGPVGLLHPDDEDVQRALEAGCRVLWVDSSAPSEQAHRLGDVELPEHTIAFARFKEDRAARWGDPNENDPTGVDVPVEDAVAFYNRFPVVATRLEYAHLFGRRIEFVAIMPNMMVLAVMM